MSTDQRTLYASCRAVIDGKWSTGLELGTLGPLNHARWITLALRLNFIYMATVDPPEEITRLAWFVVNIYGYLWFLAKSRWRAYQAPEIVFKTMKLIHALPLHEQRIICPVFERGFLYWMHPENLFLACLASNDADIRSRAIARIIQIRADASGSSSTVMGRKRGRKSAPKVRILELPDPIYSAQDFSSMIDWDQSQKTEPPLLRDLSKGQIEAFQTTPFTCEQPSNTQHVERFIQLIAKNGTRAASSTMRRGLCHATINSRSRRSGNNSKAAFAV